MSDTSNTDSDRARTDADARTDVDDRTDRDLLNTDAMKWLSALVALVGLYLAASPFIFESTEMALWNDLLVGAGIVLLAGYNFVRLSRDRLASVGAASLTVLLGLWAFVSPMIIEMGSNELATSTAVAGAIVVVLSAYNAYANSKADAPARARRTRA